MNWLLIIIIIILLGSALRGYQSGFIKTAFALVSILIALVATTIVSPAVSKALRSNETVVEKVNEQLEKVIKFDQEIKKTSQETSFIEKLTLPESIKNTLVENNNTEVYKAMAVDSFEDYVVNALSVIVINAASYIVCFLVVLIALFIISHVLNLISKLPLLNEVNKAAGLVVGLLGGCVKVWIFFLVITLFSTTTLGENIFAMINSSPLLTLIYDNNLLLKGIVNITQSIF